MDLYNFNGNLYVPNKDISILFIGNSLTQDGISYLPYLLYKYFPEINFKFYIWYNGGFTLEQQYNSFVNNTPCDIFSTCENYISWTNSVRTVKMTDVLTNYQFDVVCIQEYFRENINTNYTVDDLVHWDNIVSYLCQHYTKNSLEFITFAHSPRRNYAETVFNNMLNALRIILKNTIAVDVIPNGFAMKLALDTELDELGDSGHLSQDGTHSQEGLPCLLETFTTACWLLDKLSIQKSIYNCNLRMTTALFNTLNVPGQNLGSGVITGTDEQNLLAQKVAILGYKEGKKFVSDNLA